MRPEFDFATDAKPEETLRVLSGWAQHKYLQGITYGTVGARREDIVVEITTFRKEVYREDDRHPQVTFGTDITEDLGRRDFTVNAMAVRLPEREFLDPFGGVKRPGGEAPRHADGTWTWHSGMTHSECCEPRDSPRRWTWRRRRESRKR